MQKKVYKVKVIIKVFQAYICVLFVGITIELFFNLQIQISIIVICNIARWVKQIFIHAKKSQEWILFIFLHFYSHVWFLGLCYRAHVIS